MRPPKCLPRSPGIFSLQDWLWGGFGIGFDGRRCIKSSSDGVRRSERFEVLSFTKIQMPLLARCAHPSGVLIKSKPQPM